MTVFFINPFLEAAGGDYESIATVTVGSGGASSIEFTSISGSYQHVQVRGIVRGAASFTSGYLYMQMNGVTSSSYSSHELYGDGASPYANGYANDSKMIMATMPLASATASVFGGIVLTVLDYASTSKTKTVRGFDGFDRNGGGEVAIHSGLLNSTSAVTSIKLYLDSSNFAQHTTLALYGIKAP